MCSEPLIRAPRSGWVAVYSSRVAIRPGHLVLGELDSLTTELGQREVGHLVVEGGLVSDRRGATLTNRYYRAGLVSAGWVSSGATTVSSVCWMKDWPSGDMHSARAW